MPCGRIIKSLQSIWLEKTWTNSLVFENNRLKQNKNCSLVWLVPTHNGGTCLEKTCGYQTRVFDSFLQGVFEGVSVTRYLKYHVTERAGEDYFSGGKRRIWWLGVGEQVRVGKSGYVIFPSVIKTNMKNRQPWMIRSAHLLTDSAIRRGSRYSSSLRQVRCLGYLVWDTYRSSANLSPLGPCQVIVCGASIPLPGRGGSYFRKFY